ncbi:MAG TPA: aldo/keto reductase, partial [Gemmatimonadaceae bacterium]|nr:aldo/keto reductase [Gemmatimonadaceae bacterium]
PEARVLPECARLAIAFLPYLPLKGGLLTGKYRKNRPMPEDTRMAKVERYRKFLTHQNLNQVERLIDYARIRGHTVLDLAVSWLLAHGVVASVIAGATSAAQVRANVRAANWRLGATDLAEIDRLLSSGGSMSRWVTRAHDFLSRAPQ